MGSLGQSYFHSNSVKLVAFFTVLTFIGAAKAMAGITVGTLASIKAVAPNYSSNYFSFHHHALSGKKGEAILIKAVFDKVVKILLLLHI